MLHPLALHVPWLKRDKLVFVSLLCRGDNLMREQVLRRKLLGVRKPYRAHPLTIEKDPEFCHGLQGEKDQADSPKMYSVPTKAPGLTMWASRATTATQHQPRLDLSQIRSLGQGMLMCFSGKLASHVLLSLIYGSEIKNFCCCCCLWDIRAAMFCTAGQQSPIVVIIIPMERRFVTGGFVMLSTKLLWTRLDQPF